MAKVLIVDDSKLARRILRMILEQAGHQVVEATDGLDALERYALERPQVVLLDMTMTGMHGLEVLDRLRAMDLDACVIIATADVQSSTREMSAAAGSCGFVQKPFSPDEVVAAVASALQGGSHDADC